MQKLSCDEMETLTDQRARLDAELEILQQRKDDIMRDIQRIEDVLSVIDKIIDETEVIYE